MRLIRSGDEPVHARSPLRMRFWLALWGTLWMIAGTVFFVAVDQPVWAGVTAALALITAIDIAVVIRHIRQGSRFQPGPGVPPYEPTGEDEEPREPIRGDGDPHEPIRDTRELHEPRRWR
ncbi:DUF6343 family protein [Streptomyces sp. CNZ287]|uniref:DUF6343 family protein n=1 Tax=Streptomyces sp. B22F1 TaxID=3153566 RepID=UPI00119ACF7D